MPRLPVLPRFVRAGAFAAALAVVVYFSLLDAPPAAFEPTPWYDKQLHFAAYAAVTATAAGVTIEVRDRRWYRIGLVVAFAFAFGVAIELVQWPLADRYASVADVVANVLGTVLGSTVFLVEDALGYADDPADDARA
ncbi:VanZ family protein [Halorubellus sp. PRR65]|uniref:VanZ family protein n=1 Tax=Halorubellus sp. PRR65 TaxID=3098148 RepID=UPI002B258BBA|nr:VanZ family protein [Halorubellus sp. PRR65]